MKNFILLMLIAFSAVSFQIVNEQVIKHNGYTIYYDAAIKAPDSVSWNLSPTDICAKVSRANKFAQDPLLQDGPKPSDFVQISTDKKLEGAKGHLYSYESAMCNPVNRIECFYVDQMYWQYQSFNAGDWKTVEVYERQLAAQYNIHVIAGYVSKPVGVQAIQQVLSTGIPIVAYMYKAIYCNGQWTCWIMPNQPTSKGHDKTYWLVSKEDLDTETGLKI